MFRLRVRAENAMDDRIAAWLRPGLVILDLETDAGIPPVAGFLRSVSRSIALEHHLDAVSIHDALWRREQAASTAIGSGVAVPHARIGCIDRPIVSFIRPKRAIPFGAADGLPVSSCVVIMVPRDGADEGHLALLARVARIFSDRLFREQVDHARDVPTVRAAFDAAISRSLRR